MQKKNLKLTLLGLLVLVIAGGGMAYMTSGYKSKNAVKVGAKNQRPSNLKMRGTGPTPSASVGNRTPSINAGAGEESPGEIARAMDELHRIRYNPTPENVQKVIDLLAKSRNDVVLSEAIDTLGAIALKGTDKDLAFKVLSEKAMDQNFPQRARALLTSAIIGKDKVLPIISALIDDKGAELAVNSNKQAVIARALNMVSSPACIPLLAKVIAETSDPGARRNSYEAMARIGTPDAFSFLQQQVQSTKGADQVASVVALARSNDPKLRQWIAGAIQDGALSMDAIRALSTSPAAPDIFGNVMTMETDPAKKLDMLKDISTVAIGGPAEVREKLAVALAPLVYSNDVKLQQEAIEVIGRIGGEEVSDILKPFLSSNDPDVRRDAFFSYLRFARPDNYKYLFDFLNDPDQRTRRVAISMIGRFYTKSDRSALEQAAQSQDPFISGQAKQYLSSLN